MNETVGRGLRAGATAALLSGSPSTLQALLTGRSPWEATEAAGSILLRHTTARRLLVMAALPIHLALSLGWGIVLSAMLPRRHTIAWGAAAGLGIAALDLGVIGPRFPRIRDLPPAGQIADHVAFGLVTAAMLRGERPSSAVSAGRSSS